MTQRIHLPQGIYWIVFFALCLATTLVIFQKYYTSNFSHSSNYDGEQIFPLHSSVSSSVAIPLPQEYLNLSIIPYKVLLSGDWQVQDFSLEKKYLSFRKLGTTRNSIVLYEEFPKTFSNLREFVKEHCKNFTELERIRYEIAQESSLDGGITAYEIRNACLHPVQQYFDENTIVVYEYQKHYYELNIDKEIPESERSLLINAFMNIFLI